MNTSSSTPAGSRAKGHRRRSRGRSRLAQGYGSLHFRAPDGTVWRSEWPVLRLAHSWPDLSHPDRSEQRACKQRMRRRGASRPGRSYGEHRREVIFIEHLVDPSYHGRLDDLCDPLVATPLGGSDTIEPSSELRDRHIEKADGQQFSGIIDATCAPHPRPNAESPGLETRRRESRRRCSLPLAV